MQTFLSRISLFNQGFLRVCKHIGFVVLMFLLTGGSLTLLLNIEQPFRTQHQVRVYDTQDNLTIERIKAQLPLYQGESLAIYQRFVAVDFVFPLVAGLFLVSLWAWLLSTLSWRWAQALRDYGFYCLPLITTLADYGENFSFLSIVHGSNPPSEAIMNLALSFKWFKLNTLGLAYNLSLLFVVIAVIHWLIQRWRTWQKRHHTT